MPTIDRTPIGAPCWIELATSDPGRSEPFYTELFGWAADHGGPEYGGYVTYTLDGVPVAGSMANDGSAGPTDFWSVYLATRDARASVDAAVAHGGQVLLAPTQLMKLGTMAVLLDPGQAGICIWEPDQHPGFGVLAEPGAPSWFELHTRAYDESVAFYRDVFGWPLHVASDTPDLRYSTYGKDEDARAGIMDATAFLPEGASAAWTVYFGVTDADRAIGRAGELGGAPVQGPDDTPYGRLAEITDPNGARFRIVQP